MQDIYVSSARFKTHFYLETCRRDVKYQANCCLCDTCDSESWNVRNTSFISFSRYQWRHCYVIIIMFGPPTIVVGSGSYKIARNFLLGLAKSLWNQHRLSVRRPSVTKVLTLATIRRSVLPLCSHPHSARWRYDSSCYTTQRNTLVFFLIFGPTSQRCWSYRNGRVRPSVRLYVCMWRKVMILPTIGSTWNLAWG